MGPLKTLIHVHTNYSPDAATSPETLARRAADAGIDCIAVTDHDTIEGARHLASITDLRVIIGAEVSTRDGDIIGLFLREPVPPRMSARETAVAIREQGGLVLVPHPFLRLLGCGLRDAIWDILDLVDAVEVCNGQNIMRGPDIKAAAFALRVGLPAFVGSDSHTPCSIAPCWQMLRPFSGPVDFLNALRMAELHAGRHPLRYFASAGYRTARYLLGCGFPSGFGENHDRTAESGQIQPRDHRLGPAERILRSIGLLRPSME